MSRNLYDLIGLVAAVCFILALKGLSSPKSARRGNLIGALGATIATVIVFFYANGGQALNNQTLILVAIAFGVIVGVPAARKVQMTQMPQLIGVLASGVWVITSGGTTPLLVNGVLSLFFGVLFVLPVGGADVPIVISLLNAFTGLTVAASGYVLQTTVLIVAGTLVGASGTILTRLMAEAMGRSLFGTLFGAFTAKATAQTGQVDARPVKSGSAEDVAILLNYAQRVVIVPGFGLAVAQAQHTVRELADLLASKGVEVAYGIHPVAGRMPGHMNVLLAEANVPYEQLVEMEEINPTFPQTDVVLVVGANDVVNPAAKTTPGCPIYGMPILDVALAANVIFLKRSMRPGFAGIENELLYEPKTTLLFGDAKDSLTKVVSALKGL